MALDSRRTCSPRAPDTATTAASSSGPGPAASAAGGCCGPAAVGGAVAVYQLDAGEASAVLGLAALASPCLCCCRCWPLQVLLFGWCSRPRGSAGCRDVERSLPREPAPAPDAARSSLPSSSAGASSFRSGCRCRPSAPAQRDSPGVQLEANSGSQSASNQMHYLPASTPLGGRQEGPSTGPSSRDPLPTCCLGAEAGGGLHVVRIPTVKPSKREAAGCCRR